MRTMAFLPELKEFLLRNGRIYTVRGYDMDERDVFVEDVGVCHRKPLGTVLGASDLEPFAPLGSFSDSKAWEQAIKRFITNPDAIWFLYEVTLKEKGGD